MFEPNTYSIVDQGIDSKTRHMIISAAFLIPASFSSHSMACSGDQNADLTRKILVRIAFGLKKSGTFAL